MRFSNFSHDTRIPAMVLALLIAAPTTALAQTAGQIPGLIVSVPSDNDNGAGQSGGSPSVGGPANPLLNTRPRNATPRQQSAPSRPVKKKRASLSNSSKKSTKAKARKRPVTRSASARRKHSVAVLVNDEPITHHEIDQRARLLALSSRLGSRVKANFQALIKRKSTNQRLRAILGETIKANPGKSRDQVLAIFEKRETGLRAVFAAASR